MIMILSLLILAPHLDPFLLNGLAASDLLLTPTPRRKLISIQLSNI